MKSVLLTLIVLFSVAISATSSHAQDEGTKAPASGFEAGVQLGYGVPLGDAAKDSPLTDLVVGKLPIIVDAGYRVMDRFYAGAFVQYAPAFLAEDVCPGADCSASVLRYGIEGQVHFFTRERWEPWAGFGVGFETLGLDFAAVIADAADAETNISGLEYGHLSAGADYRISEQVGVGPFLTLTLAEYSEVAVKAGSTKLNADIDEPALHEWLIVGVRARFNP